MSIFTKIGAWFAKAFITVKDKLMVVAVVFTEAIKTLEDDGVLPEFATILDGATDSEIPTEVNAVIQKDVNKALAVELAIEALPDAPTPDDIKTFSTNVVTALDGKTPDARGQFLSTFATKAYDIIYTAVHGQASPLTFAQKVNLGEEIYQEYVVDKAAETASLAPVGLSGKEAEQKDNA